ncbi:cytochrome P450 3A28-like isoform X4 [Porites lutea]|uniref:cytochrome P450 3A28-like isoform X4 n=1 Tax=Porites lutea TaxID=51062 RepID=UPI003CC606F5
MGDLLHLAIEFMIDHWITLAIGLLVLLIHRYCIAPYTVFKKLGIPGPTPIPFFGTSAVMLFNPHKGPLQTLERYKKYGKVYGSYLFREPFLVVGDLDMVKEILVKEFPKFHDRKAVLEVPKPYDRMLTIVAGQKWKDIRNTLTPTFSAHKMKQMMSFMNDALDTLLLKVDGISKTGEIVDFHRWLQSLTMEVILSTAFGVKSETQTVENDPVTEMAKKAMAPNPIFPLLMLLPFGNLIGKCLPDPLNFNGIGKVAEDIITERTKANGHSKLNESPSYDVLHQMPYLDMVINETLRIYPPGFLLQRDCNEACTIKGVHIPKGLPIIIPVYPIHHDPDIWPEPEKFDPERFSEAEKSKRHPYAFMPFGYGPRNCVGMRFALLEIKLTVAKLLKKYKLERTEKTAVPLNFIVGAVLTCPPGKIMLRVSPRD